MSADLLHKAARKLLEHADRMPDDFLIEVDHLAREAMHPDVARELADWLCVMEAGILRTWGDTPESDLPIPYQAALSVARAVLGEAAS